VAEVDLFTGMLAEKPLPGGGVGPTIACILADQFSRIRRGDRFWYEGDIYTGHFKPRKDLPLNTPIRRIDFIN
jgi:peroxidase